MVGLFCLSSRYSWKCYETKVNEDNRNELVTTISASWQRIRKNFVILNNKIFLVQFVTYTLVCSKILAKFVDCYIENNCMEPLPQIPCYTWQFFYFLCYIYRSDIVTGQSFTSQLHRLFFYNLLSASQLFLCITIQESDRVIHIDGCIDLESYRFGCRERRSLIYILQPVLLQNVTVAFVINVKINTFFINDFFSINLSITVS